MDLKELQKKILSKILDNGWNDENSIIIDNITYSITEEEELPIENKGKYQNGGTVYKVCKEDDEESLFFIMQSWSRTGIYYEQYTIDKPCIVEKA